MFEVSWALTGIGDTSAHLSEPNSKDSTPISLILILFFMLPIHPTPRNVPPRIPLRGGNSTFTIIPSGLYLIDTKLESFRIV